MNVNYRINTHACAGTDAQIDLRTHARLPARHPHSITHITHIHSPRPPDLTQMVGSKLQSCETLKPQSISPRDSDFPAELLTCTTTAHSHRIWCYVPERDGHGERQTDRQKGSQGGGRERAGAETQLPTVELYRTVYKKETLREEP